MGEQHRVTNDRLRQIMEIKHPITDDIVTKLFIWFGHVQKMGINAFPNNHKFNKQKVK